MKNGWIKVHNKFINWEWAGDPNMVSLFLHLLLMANWKDKRWMGITIKRGQLVTGLKSLSKKTGISVQTLRTGLTRLKSTGEITNESTNKYRLITIINWEQYQGRGEKSTSKKNNQLTIHQQSTNNQLTTTKDNKEYKILNTYREMRKNSFKKHLTSNLIK